MSNYLYNNSKLKERRKELRNNLTPAEAILWNYLKGKQLGIKFRRQYSVGKYILDFYCTKLRLAIEIDGEVHNNLINVESDTLRQKYIEDQDITVIRFTNETVYKNIAYVLEEIRNAIK